MSKKLYEEQDIQDIANAIREKNGTETKYLPSEMGGAIRAIGSVRSLKKLLDVSKSTKSMFEKNKEITDVSDLFLYDDTSEVTNMSYMFRDCTALTTMPAFDTRNVTDGSAMFHTCSNLETIPPTLNTSNMINMNNVFAGCNKLTSLPLIDTSKATNIDGLFNSCYELLEINPLNTDNVTNFTRPFYQTLKLTEVTLSSTKNGTLFEAMFWRAIRLVTINCELDFTKALNINNVFTNCIALVNVRFKEKSVFLDLSIAQSQLLSDESIQSIIDGLADLTGGTAKTLTLHTDVKAKLTEEQITSITSKNWNLA